MTVQTTERLTPADAVYLGQCSSEKRLGESQEEQVNYNMNQELCL